MNSYKKIKKYSVFEINEVIETLRSEYDIVRLVDAEECRILDVTKDGTIVYGDSCFCIWDRKNRCANCSSYRACMTHTETDKIEHLGRDRESIHSIPIYLEMKNGESELCVIECVNYAGTEDDGYVETTPDEYISTHDVLTRLYSHEKLFREIRNRLNKHENEEYLLVIINVRNFTLVNNLFGVEKGNRLLIGIADVLRTEFTKEEVYGRYRDDRFALLIKKEKFSEDVFLEHINCVESIIESPIFKVKIKLGVYEIPGKDMPVSSMFEHAEIAVDSIRDSQAQSISHYDPMMMERKIKGQRIVTNFSRALGDGEFQIFLQPQVDKSGVIYGAEALVRWIKPDGTRMLPGEFLEVLHKAELLSHLDVYVWEKAAELLCRWRGTELEKMFISVNVDPSDFYYMNVPETLGAICRSYSLPPEKLHIEITENALFGDYEQEGHIVDKLHDEGFIVEIDDFGKGYSSLSMLKSINADVLKIDMGFIAGQKNRDRSTVILRSVIDMSGKLGMTAISEGVETKEQLDDLVALGCRRFQGFYFSMPLPVKDFETVALGAD